MSATPATARTQTGASAPAKSLPHATVLSGSRTVSWWGMVLLIATEATVFAALISSYFYLRTNSPAWPAGNIDRPELLLAGINTLILVSSSWPMQMSVRSIRQNNNRGLLLGLAIGGVLGVLFLSLQAVEYSRASFAMQTNVYGSLFFTITGLHGLHVLVGLGMVVFVLVRAFLKHFDSHRYQAVENAVLYWHFVDAVWIVVFSSLYLSTYLTG